MKRLSTIAAIVVLLLTLAAPAFADSLGSLAPTPEPTTEPGGGEEEPTEEPTEVVDTDEPTQSGGEEGEEELADTGIDASTLALIAGGLLLAGGLGLFAARRAGKVQ